MRQHYVLQVAESARETQEFQELANLLSLQSKRLAYDIDRTGQLPEQAGELTLQVETRSVLGAMAYLSQAVQLPPEHARRRLASRDADVEAVLSDLLRIKVADKAPKDAMLSVPHRGYWFYIEESDLPSKRTMGLLTSLVRLEISTGGAQNVPVLTLPVSR